MATCRRDQSSAPHSPFISTAGVIMCCIPERNTRRACCRAALPLVLVAGVLGCDSPTRPRASGAPAPLAAVPAVSAALRAGLADARERILPALPQAADPEALGGMLDQVAAALSARDGAG